MNILKKHIRWLLPVVLFILITPFTPKLDLEISRFFYDQQDGEKGSFVSNELTYGIFHYGVLPAWILVGLASLVLILSYVSAPFKKWRDSSLLLVLTLAIGSGMITNALLKDNWGRPRPRQIIEFGGTQEFRPYYSPNFFDQPEPSKSFPSGHASMGFYFFALALAGKRLNKPVIFYIGISLAIIFGIALSLTRVAQGGHFFSDVMTSALIMWLTALTFNWLLAKEKF